MLGNECEVHVVGCPCDDKVVGSDGADVGIPLRVLQDILGYASVETTQGYLHPNERHLATAAEQANPFLARSATTSGRARLSRSLSCAPDKPGGAVVHSWSPYPQAAPPQDTKPMSRPLRRIGKGPDGDQRQPPPATTKP